MTSRLVPKFVGFDRTEDWKQLWDLKEFGLETMNNAHLQQQQQQQPLQQQQLQPQAYNGSAQGHQGGTGCIDDVAGKAADLLRKVPPCTCKSKGLKVYQLLWYIYNCKSDNLIHLLLRLMTQPTLWKCAKLSQKLKTLFRWNMLRNKCVYSGSTFLRSKNGEQCSWNSRRKRQRTGISQIFLFWPFSRLTLRACARSPF